jgi:hypothetical protein
MAETPRKPESSSLSRERLLELYEVAGDWAVAYSAAEVAEADHQARRPGRAWNQDLWRTERTKPEMAGVIARNRLAGRKLRSLVLDLLEEDIGG